MRCNLCGGETHRLRIRRVENEAGVVSMLEGCTSCVAAPASRLLLHQQVPGCHPQMTYAYRDDIRRRKIDSGAGDGVNHVYRDYGRKTFFMGART